ncbi:MAG: type II toxin-antitoxin system VapC family toxin [Acidobacteriaceae bacterium]|nr:type II toxin-antitoxin system VapC family toxin [Acidobacteriaceae bacterium]
MTRIFWFTGSIQKPRSIVRPARSLDAARTGATTLYVTSQILCEFYSVITNARRVSKPRRADEAIGAIAALLSFLHVLPIPARTVEGWLDLLGRRPVTGGQVLDLQLAAAMLANGVQRIYTYNTSDLKASKNSLLWNLSAIW